MVAAELGPHAAERDSILDRLSPTQLRWAGVAAAAIGLVAAINVSTNPWEDTAVHASAPVPSMEQVALPPAQPWRAF